MGTMETEVGRMKWPVESYVDKVLTFQLITTILSYKPPWDDPSFYKLSKLSTLGKTSPSERLVTESIIRWDTGKINLEN